MALPLELRLLPLMATLLAIIRKRIFLNMRPGGQEVAKGTDLGKWQKIRRPGEPSQSGEQKSGLDQRQRNRLLVTDTT